MSTQPADVNDTVRQAMAHHQAGRLDEADALYTQALQVRPDHAVALHYSGAIAFYRGNHAQAIERIGRSVAIEPTGQSLLNLAIVLAAAGQLEPAVSTCRAVLRLEPDNVRALTELAQALKNLGRNGEAIEVFEKLSRLMPNEVDVFAQCGHLLQKEYLHGNAIGYYQRALELKPDYGAVWNNYGQVLQNLGKLEPALQAFRRAMELEPAHAGVHSNYLFGLLMDPDCPPERYLAEARRFGERYSNDVRPYTSWQVGQAGSEAAPLRVGLVSGDLKSHPVGFFLESVLAQLDPTRVQVVAYATRTLTDEVTTRLRRYFSEWHAIDELDDDAAARKIHDDGIHVLIDLSGHTGGNRLPVFARKPAPVQASWLGYSASTGMPSIDWLVVDPVSVPAVSRDLYSEKLWYLPETRLCLTPPTAIDDLPPTPLPALANGYVTFGNFQAMQKISPVVLAAWGRVLDRLPTARLRIQNRELSSGPVRDVFMKRMATLGLPVDRVQLEGGMPRRGYLVAHNGIDILLDTFPYPGGTTTCEALWMGVPTVTLAGRTMSSRHGMAMLEPAGLGDWVASSPEQYLEIAVTRARDLESLATLRAGLRERVRHSPLFDAPRFARNLEQALYGMWRGTSAPVAGGC